MPSIQKGAKISDSDKKKIEKLKKKGATRSELSTIRMALLRGDTYRKALSKMRAKAKEPKPKKKAKMKSDEQDVFVEEEMEIPK